MAKVQIPKKVSPKICNNQERVAKVQIPKKVSPKICNNQEGVANRAESVVEQPVVETDVARRKSGQVIRTLFFRWSEQP